MLLYAVSSPSCFAAPACPLLLYLSNLALTEFLTEFLYLRMVELLQSKESSRANTEVTNSLTTLLNGASKSKSQVTPTNLSGVG